MASGVGAGYCACLSRWPLPMSDAPPDPFTHRPTRADLDAAATRIAPYALRTPVLRSDALDELSGARLLFKCENLQRGGAFKFRGACNAVYSLDEEAAARGVLTQSSGNHGAAIALACRMRGIRATVVVPRSAPAIKRAAIAGYGAEVIDSGITIAERDAVTRDVQQRSGASFVHPFNDARVIAGQASATGELLHDHPDLDGVIAPVSGGGLLSGVALAGHRHRADLRIIGAEPAGAADALASLSSGQRVTGMKPDTNCDGLRAELGELTFAILREHRAQVVLASEAQIIAAMRLIWEQLKLVVEPSAAVALAIVLAEPQQFRGQRLGLILTGGNLDLERLPWQG